MKKFFSVLVLAGLLLVLFLPLVAMAQQTAPDGCTIRANPNITGCPASGFVSYDHMSGLGATCCLFGTIYYVTNWIFALLVAIVVLLILFGAFNLLTAAGEPEKVSKGRNYILWAAIGLFVAFFARAIPALVKLVGGFN